MAEEIFDPLKTYNTTLKKSYKENAIKVYEELVAQSKMDVEENRKTVKEYYVLVNNSKKIRSKLNGFRTLRIFLYIFCGLFVVAGILLLVFGIPKVANIGLIIGISIGLFAAGIACLVIGLTVVTKKVRELKKILSSLEAQAEEKRQLAVKQMAPLNALFDWGMPAKIVKLSSPIIELDQYFDIKKFEYLHTKYKVTENTDKDISTVMIFSGSIVGNPFMMVRDLKTAMYDKRWTGSIVIHWTETRRDSKGNTYTVNMSQTLTAYVDRPAPNYFYNTRLIYANDAAHDLHFSRKPTGATGMDENAIRRKVKKGEKTLNKLTSKALSDNDPTTNFTAMANSKFEVIFGALDRDNEVQFRLLYTPVAQLSTVNLLVNGKPYGDDFNYVKDGPLNYIGSDHSANFDYSAEPNRYMTFSVDQSKDLFVNYN